jgi:hypothetical protein
MARQKSATTLSGKLGNSVYYRRNGKDLVRKAPEPYQLTENSIKSGMEFARANRATGLVKERLPELFEDIGDGALYNRLTGRFMKLIGTGYSKPGGEREVSDGDLALLKGFEFNRFTSSHSICAIEPVVVIDPAADISITVPKFSIEQSVNAPVKAETLVIQLSCFVCDFTTEKTGAANSDDLHISLDKSSFAGGCFEFSADSTSDEAMIFTISFQFLDRDHLAIKNRNHTAARIIESVMIRDGRVTPFRYPEKIVQPVVERVKKKRIPWKLNPED